MPWHDPAGFDFGDDEFYCSICGTSLIQQEIDMYKKDKRQACLACRKDEDQSDSS